MMLLKRCLRCWGGLRINKDIYGEYKQCVQCGYMEDLDPRSNTRVVRDRRQDLQEGRVDPSGQAKGARSWQMAFLLAGEGRSNQRVVCQT